MTTPWDALHALVTKWREDSQTPMSLTPYADPRNVYAHCADDLEAVLSAALASASAGHRAMGHRRPGDAGGRRRHRALRGDAMTAEGAGEDTP